MDMYELAVLDYSERLIREGYSPSLYMTNLMLAAQKEFGITARLEEPGFHQEADHVCERWILEVEG